VEGLPRSVFGWSFTGEGAHIFLPKASRWVWNNGIGPNGDTNWGPRSDMSPARDWPTWECGHQLSCLCTLKNEVPYCSVGDNSEDCVCGVQYCSKKSGYVCSNDQCSKGPECPDNVKSDFVCKCGQYSTTGDQYCYNGIVTNKPLCTYEPATEFGCHCYLDEDVSELCSEGEYCWEGRCSPSKQFDFYYVQQESCLDISSQECQEYALNFVIEDTTTSFTTHSNVYHESNCIANTYGSNGAFNGHVNYCSTNCKSTNNDMRVCKAESAQICDLTGQTNGQTCYCIKNRYKTAVAATCSEDKYCDISTETCVDFPMCGNTNGKILNSACMCGNAECSLNQYCYEGLCYAYPICNHIEKNNATCVCRTAPWQNNCQMGQYCHDNECLDYDECQATQITSTCSCGNNCNQADSNTCDNICLNDDTNITLQFSQAGSQETQMMGLLGHTSYYKVVTGTCETHGYEIMTGPECQNILMEWLNPPALHPNVWNGAISTSVNFQDFTGTVGYATRPKGCVYFGNGPSIAHWQYFRDGDSRPDCNAHDAPCFCKKRIVAQPLQHLDCPEFKDDVKITVVGSSVSASGPVDVTCTASIIPRYSCSQSNCVSIDCENGFEDGRCKCGNEYCYEKTFASELIEFNSVCSDGNCKRFYPCVHLNGTQANPFACQCNEKTCETGLYCLYEHSSCGINGRCSSTNGLNINSEACICFDKQCEPNQFCSSGGCSDESVIDLGQNVLIEDCVPDNLGQGLYHDTSAICRCGDQYCDKTTGFHCINTGANTQCSNTGASDCENQDGTVQNTARCRCGTNECNSATGLFCSSGECKSRSSDTQYTFPELPECSINPGRLCKCGPVNCLFNENCYGNFCSQLERCEDNQPASNCICDATGQICNRHCYHEYGCTDLPKCLNTEGKIPNDPCVCGSEACASFGNLYDGPVPSLFPSNQTGFYCFEGKCSESGVYKDGDEYICSPRLSEDVCSSNGKQCTHQGFGPDCQSVQNICHDGLNEYVCRCGVNNCPANHHCWKGLCSADLQIWKPSTSVTNRCSMGYNSDSCLCSYQNICNSTNGNICQTNGTCQHIEQCESGEPVDDVCSCSNTLNCLKDEICWEGHCSDTNGIFASFDLPHCKTGENYRPCWIKDNSACTRMSGTYWNGVQCEKSTEICNNVTADVTTTQRCLCGNYECQPSEYCFYGTCYTNNSDIELMDVCSDGCTCGTQECSSGQYCFDNSCHTYPKCVENEVNSNSCMCNTHICNHQNGLFCDGSTCKHQYSCIDQQSTSPNTGTCLCGNNYCSEGEYCKMDLNYCSTEPYAPCLNIHGLHANNNTCVCTSDNGLGPVCATGDYCYAFHNATCSSVQGKFVEINVNNGTCSSNGFQNFENCPVSGQRIWDLISENGWPQETTATAACSWMADGLNNSLVLVNGVYKCIINPVSNISKQGFQSYYQQASSVLESQCFIDFEENVIKDVAACATMGSEKWLSRTGKTCKCQTNIYRCPYFNAETTNTKECLCGENQCGRNQYCQHIINACSDEKPCSVGIEASTTCGCADKECQQGELCYISNFVGVCSLPSCDSSGNVASATYKCECGPNICVQGQYCLQGECYNRTAVSTFSYSENTCTPETMITTVEKCMEARDASPMTNAMQIYTNDWKYGLLSGIETKNMLDSYIYTYSAMAGEEFRGCVVLENLIFGTRGDRRTYSVFKMANCSALSNQTHWKYGAEQYDAPYQGQGWANWQLNFVQNRGDRTACVCNLKGPVCSNNNGTTPVEKGCICQGELTKTLCADNNMYCLPNGKCASTPVCTFNNGNGINLNKCSCNEATCEANQFCQYSLSQCSTSQYFEHQGNFWPVCNPLNGQQSEFYHKAVSQCWCRDHLCTRQSGFICDNTNKQCYVSTTPCQIQNGTVPTNSVCNCGLKIDCLQNEYCQSTQGEEHIRCDTNFRTVPVCEKSTCEPEEWEYIPTCEESIKNNGKCKCDQNICPSGEYCHGSYCSLYPKCDFRNGAIINKNTCACSENNVCNSNRPYCFPSGQCSAPPCSSKKPNDICGCQQPDGITFEECDNTQYCFRAEQEVCNIPDITCGCSSEYIPDCTFTDGQNQNFEKCKCNKNICPLSQPHCNYENSICNQQPIPSCKFQHDLIPNLGQCLCKNELCGSCNSLPCDNTFFCDIDASTGSKCHKDYCANYPNQEELCDEKGYGNGLLDGNPTCEDVRCHPDIDYRHCCKQCPAIAQSIVKDGKCRQKCPENICTGDYATPLVSMELKKIQSEYNDKYDGFCDSEDCSNDQAKCCLRVKKCQEEIKDPWSYCQKSYFTQEINDVHCKDFQCDPDTCCKGIKCKCTGGIPAEGRECPSTETEKCVSCNATHWLYIGQCYPIVACQPTQYEINAPIPGIQDRACSPLRQCTNDEYISVNHTFNSNRVCQALTQCQTNQFEVTAPTNYTNRVCQTFKTCLPTQFYHPLVLPAFQDITCIDLQTCNYNTHYDGGYTLTSDRVCEPLSDSCNSSFQWEFRPDLSEDRECRPIKNCSVDEYIKQEATPTSNRLCEKHRDCLQDEYTFILPDKRQNRICNKAQTCSEDQYETEPPQPNVLNADRKCANLTVCSENQYETTTPNATTNRECRTCNFADCIGCMQENDCEYNALSKINDPLKCSGKTCIMHNVHFSHGSASFSPPIDVVMYNQHYRINLRANGSFKVIPGAALDIFPVDSIETQNQYLYFKIPSDYKSTLHYEDHQRNELKLRRDCEFQSRIVSECDSICGKKGTQLMANKHIQTPLNGGKTCPPELFIVECVNETALCPIDCQIQWETEFSPCSASCGKGMQTKKYTILTEPKHNGTACPAIETKECETLPPTGKCNCLLQVMDKCNVCGGNDECLDCLGVPNGNAVWDICGVCNGDGETCREKRKMLKKQKEETSHAITTWTPVATGVFIFSALLALFLVCCKKNTEKSSEKGGETNPSETAEEERVGNNNNKRIIIDF